ncbi:MAG TPA: hypothetical protein VHW92_05625 [Mycobacteriales bacterium]|nr:hypothetical protein [Mycobacteriales bacterium]
METNLTSWTPAAACPTAFPFPVVDARSSRIQGISVPMAVAAAYGHIGLGIATAADVTRDKDATTGGTAWGPPV